MRFQDMDTNETFTLQQLKKDWESFKDDFEDVNFPDYLCKVVDASLRYRNDLRILDMTEDEAWKLYEKVFDRFVKDARAARDAV